MLNSKGVAAKALSVKKDHQPILTNIDFLIGPGTLTGIIGPSGSGKTTLLRAIVGVQKISSGEFTVFGERAGSRGLRGRIGYMPQTAAIYDDLTVYQNLKYFGALVGVGRSEIVDVVERMRLQDQRDMLAKNLSGGQRARVSLGIALLGSPDLLVLDEPTVGLDPILRRELWQLFSELAESGKTLLVSSHVMDEAQRCHDLLLLRDGRLLWSDTKAKLLQKTGKSAVEDAFIAMINEGRRV